MKKIQYPALILACLWCIQTSALALAPPKITATAAVLYDKNGNKLFEKEGDKPLQPASVTKIMTMLIAMEELAAGRLRLEDRVRTSAYAASMGGTQVYLKEGEEMTVHDLLKAIAVASANDGAVALGEHIAGSEEAFVAKMNERAAELGMKNSTFVNANGLDMGGKITLTTANDLALASVALLKYPSIASYTSIWMDSLRDGAFTLANTNKMLKTYTGLYGLKTGYTNEAKYCISAAARREDLDLIAVVMQASTKEIRNADVAALLNYGFANYANVDVGYNENIETDIKGGTRPSIRGIIHENTTLLLEKTKVQNMENQLVFYENLTAPIKKGEKIGDYIIKAGGVEIRRFDVAAAEDIDALGVVGRFVRMMKFIFLQKTI